MRRSSKRWRTDRHSHVQVSIRDWSSDEWLSPGSELTRTWFNIDESRVTGKTSRAVGEPLMRAGSTMCDGIASQGNDNAVGTRSVTKALRQYGQQEIELGGKSEGRIEHDETAAVEQPRMHGAPYE